MKMIPIPVHRSSLRFLPDSKRVITKPFTPGGKISQDGRTRIERILDRIFALSEDETKEILNTIRKRFSNRHRDIDSIFSANFSCVAERFIKKPALSTEQRLLIGAYFTHEYSIDSAALTNPSMVKAPDQTGLAPGNTRFILSLRAIGEGHISSIEFRSGVIDATGEIKLEVPSQYVETARHEPPIYEKAIFQSKLIELHAYNEIAAQVMGSLAPKFSLGDLEKAIAVVEQQHVSRSDSEIVAHATRTLHWLASSNYQSSFSPDTQLSERVLFPTGPTESSGMEDARFVRFIRDDGTVTHFATYTAYDGHQILPQLIETPDFLTYRIATLNGACAENKGIALFPRKIDGLYFALARQDNENNFLMWSDNVRFWHESQLIQEPVRSWEMIQLGNCGSPLETDAGWLVITHGVGAMRQYALGAILLDKEDPSKVIGHLAEPLLEPIEEERDGYVPNVVYSCGGMIAGDQLVLPYGFGDIGTRIATFRLDDVLSALTMSK